MQSLRIQYGKLAWVKNLNIKLGGGVYTSNPSTWEAEAAGSLLSSRPACSTKWALQNSQGYKRNHVLRIEMSEKWIIQSFICSLNHSFHKCVGYTSGWVLRKRSQDKEQCSCKPLCCCDKLLLVLQVDYKQTCISLSLDWKEQPYPNNPEMKELVLLYSLQCVIEGSQGKNLEVRIEAETMKACCLLACFPWLAQATFLYSPGPPSQESHYPQWPAFPPIINQENAPQICPQTNLAETNPQLFPPFQVISMSSEQKLTSTNRRKGNQDRHACVGRKGI